MPRLPYHPLAALLCTTLAGGCASGPEPLAPELRQHLGKVYLNSAGASGEVFFDDNIASGSMLNAMKGAGKGLGDGLGDCLTGALAAAGLGPASSLVMLICVPLQVPQRIAEGSEKQTRYGIVPPEQLAALAQETNEALKNADLSPALVAALDELGQQNSALASYEITHNTLPAPADGETVADVAGRWDYQTVMEVEVTKAGVHVKSGKVPLVQFSMTADIRLMKAPGGKVIHRETYEMASEPQAYQYWSQNNMQSLAKAMVETHRDMARKIVDDIFIR